MIIKRTIGIKKYSLSSRYVPIGYWKVTTPYQRKKSAEVVIYDKYEDIIGVGRNLYISRNLREISDIWISPEYRGKMYKSKKYSHYLIEKLIEGYSDNKKLKINTSKLITINLEVHKENIKAMKLYEKYNFSRTLVNKTSKTRKEWIKRLGLKNTFTMSRTNICIL
jgi:GNAT superfamily N-acetyltransferase